MNRNHTTDLMVILHPVTGMWFVGRYTTSPTGRTHIGGVYSRPSFRREDAEAAMRAIDAEFPNRADFFAHRRAEKLAARA